MLKSKQIQSNQILNEILNTLENIESNLRVALAKFLIKTGHNLDNNLGAYLKDINRKYYGKQEGIEKIVDHHLNKILGKYYLDLKKQNITLNFARTHILKNLFGGNYKC